MTRTRVERYGAPVAATSRSAAPDDDAVGAATTPAQSVDFPPDRRPWSLTRGAMLLGDGAVRFEVWAPFAERVTWRVLGGRAAGDHPLERGDGGVFAATVANVGAEVDYRLVMHRGEDPLERPDPVSRFQPHGVHGPSRVVDPRAFGWSDHGWRGREMADYAIYELHVGTLTSAGTFDAAIERLPALRELGITAIELMPVAQFPGGRNWGYDGVDLYAPQSTYGGPEALRRLVDAAHRADLAVVLDVVYNHLGPEGNYLGDFGPYFTERYRTPWGCAVNYDDAGSDEVRRFVIENALYWVTEFHVDALRLDAVHAIFDFSARHILEELGAAVHEQAARLGRTVNVIAESDLNDPRLLRDRALGGYGLDAQWSDDFHHAVHVALTGEHHGYYEDFAAAPVAQALRDRFVYGGRHSPHRRRRHGARAADLPADRFVVFTQNHDQVGNRATGDRLSTLVSPAELRLAAAALLLSPYVPLLFMGEEYGETNPFLYFVSHGDPELVEAVREGRRREFAAFEWNGDVPDPQAEETFARSLLDPMKLERREHRELYTLHRDLLHLRREHRLLRPGAAKIDVRSGPPPGWLTITLTPPSQASAGGGLARGPATALVVALNFAREPGQAPLPSDEAAGSTASPSSPPWETLLSTDAPAYGGAGESRVDTSGGRSVLTLAPSSAVLLAKGPR